MKRKKVDFIIYESTCIRYERFNRRLIFLIIFLLLILVSSNLGWIIYHSQFEVSKTANAVTTHIFVRKELHIMPKQTIKIRTVKKKGESAPRKRVVKVVKKKKK